MTAPSGWRVSSHCSNYGCVAVRITESTVFVQHSSGGPVLAFDLAEWDTFVAGVRDGEFDVPEETNR